MRSRKRGGGGGRVKKGGSRKKKGFINDYTLMKGRIRRRVGEVTP